jgi:lactate dehydrogenase-like 2-hydroxyacid dehydrogenase
VLLTTGGRGASAALIEAMPKLEVIGVNGVGYDKVDVAAARARGIVVSNTPDVLTDDVADLAIGLMIATHRRIAAADRFVRRGDWAAGKPFPLSRRLSGRRLGIVGLGRIGLAIAARAAPMMPDIAYCARHRRADVAYRYFADPVALAEAVDVLVLCVPGSAATEGLIDAAVIAALGPQGVLINVARGSVVDEDALVAALAEGGLGGAGLDVFADEPQVPPALLAMDTVVLQPHLGSATIETRRDMAQLVIDNVLAHLAGQPLLTPVG